MAIEEVKKKKCPNCDGSGFEACEHCEGSGEQPCTQCGETGEVEEDEDE